MADLLISVLEERPYLREIQKHLRKNNVKLESEADPDTSGPASIGLLDPDGNAILIDQHV